MEKQFVLFAPEGFKDGQITECPFIGRGKTVTVSENVATKIMASNPYVEVVEVLVPNPKKQVAKDE